MALRTGKTLPFYAHGSGGRCSSKLPGNSVCNKIAFGHHKDDVIETFFLNIFYGASVSTMNPVQEFFGGKLFAIRPFFMIDSDLIRRYFRSMGWQAVDLGCPTAGSFKERRDQDDFNQLYRGNRKIKGNIFHALQNVKPEYLL